MRRPLEPSEHLVVGLARIGFHLLVDRFEDVSVSVAVGPSLACGAPQAESIAENDTQRVAGAVSAQACAFGRAFIVLVTADQESQL